MLHRAERRIATTKTVRETEAEAVAFVVGKTIGLQTNRASADYIHLYHGNAALLTESLEVIQKTSAVILSALEKSAAEPTEEPKPDRQQATYPPLKKGGRRRPPRSTPDPHDPTAQRRAPMH